MLKNTSNTNSKLILLHKFSKIVDVISVNKSRITYGISILVIFLSLINLKYLSHN